MVTGGGQAKSEGEAMGSHSAAVEPHMVKLYESLSEKDRRRYAARAVVTESIATSRG
jgi:hypothetical protein